MKLVKVLLFWLLAAHAGLLWAQTNPPIGPLPQPRGDMDIYSDTGYYDGLSNKLVYLGHVFASDHVKAQLTCEWLTVDVPREGEHPTNIVAETNVVADVVAGGQTNHFTAAKAIYTYNVGDGETNEIVEFTRISEGDPLPKLENAKIIQTGDPMFFNITKQLFYGGTNNFHTILKPRPKSGNGTNASPLGF